MKGRSMHKGGPTLSGTGSPDPNLFLESSRSVGYFNTLSKESDHTDTGTTTLCFLLRTIIKNPPPSLLLASLLLQSPAFSSGYPPPLPVVRRRRLDGYARDGTRWRWWIEECPASELGRR
ncbi:hypothetical protein HanXRQr2_Chr10g0448711 [Helianthus annuus]|uniref:Uncharacterized protein n=1 Tax=Helianthus annuus TaxID=4232 RepID=A0A251TLK0_HELAN|nr:hypothetical protein HanXRQr2_Chr10g0448711 [Helianthus annuus]